MPVEKKLDFRQKIDIILRVKGLAIKNLEQEWGKSGTLYKAYEENREFSLRIRDEFLQKFNIKKTWWLKPTGDEAGDVFEENNTSVPEPAINEKEKDPYELIRILTRNIDRMGELNEYLLKKVKDLGG
jgi:hypothetical protein